jgi:hypothetical protein
MVLVSRAGRPPMVVVVFGLGRWKSGKPSASHRTRTPETCPGVPGLRGVWY